MSLAEILLARFGPLMSYADMATLFGCQGADPTSAMRQRMRRDKVLGQQIRQSTLRLGRRVYFRSDLVAQALSTASVRTSSEAAVARHQRQSGGALS